MELSFNSKLDFFWTVASYLEGLSHDSLSLDKLRLIVSTLNPESQSAQVAKDFVEAHWAEFVEFIERGRAYTEYIQSTLNPTSSPGGPDPGRIYMDGCFDLMHSGHFNAIRQCKIIGVTLVVGVHSDAEITRNKGPPVMNEAERYAMVRACKWVDEMIEDAPYSPTVELLDR
jgi:cytidyltransferase-like protein